MQLVEVSKTRLLERLKENRNKHRQMFEEALAGWQRNVIDELQRAVKDAKAGRRYTTTIFLPQPSDHTAEYDSKIDQVEWSVDETIELNPLEFNQFVRDDWGWKEDFINTATAYLNYKK